MCLWHILMIKHIHQNSQVWWYMVAQALNPTMPNYINAMTTYQCWDLKAPYQNVQKNAWQTLQHSCLQLALHTGLEKRGIFICWNLFGLMQSGWPHVHYEI